MVTKAIVVGTNYGREQYVKAHYDGWKALAQLTDASLIVRPPTNDKDAFETCHIRWGTERYDKVLFLQDSIAVTEPESLAEYLLKEDDYYWCSRGMSYLATFQKSKNNVPIPYTKDKAGSVKNETNFMQKYIGQEHVRMVRPLVTDTNVFVQKFGKKMMVIEGKGFIKYKSVWNPQMIDPETNNL